MPKTILVDRGIELNAVTEVVHDLAAHGLSVTTVRALSYNPQAKPIEGLFANLNKLVYSKIPGFTGGKPRKLRRRLSEKSAPVFPGGWNNLRDHLTVLIADYHTRSRSKLPSPEDRYRAAIAGTGTAGRSLPRDYLITIAARLEARVLQKGSLHYHGKRVTNDGFYAMRGGKPISILAPTDRQLPPLAFDRHGRAYQTTYDESFALIDDARTGAKESQRRQHITISAVDDYSAEVGPIKLTNATLSASVRCRRIKHEVISVVADDLDYMQRQSPASDPSPRSKRYSVEAVKDMLER